MSNHTGRVQGKVAFITGAARGQGRNHAIALASEGADIIAVDLCEEIGSVPYTLAPPGSLEETARLVEEAGGRIHIAKADVRDLAALEAAVAEGVAKFGRLDIVLANAGILSSGRGWELTEEQWNDMIDINLSGVWRTVKASVPAMIEAGNGGSIVLTSSVAGLRTYAGVGHYASSKHALMGLMKTLALELAEFNIRINTVNPTQCDTDMIQNEALYRIFVPGDEVPTKEQFAQASNDSIALDIPWVEMDDVTKAIMFLVSDDARYITGIGLPVDGGALLR